MPQGRHIQHFLQRTLKEKNLQYKKMLHLFCKGVPFDFCICYFSPFLIEIIVKNYKSSVSKSAPIELPTSDSFRLCKGGVHGV